MSYEGDLQKEINKELRDAGIKYLHIEKGRGKNKTHRAGWPDLIIFPGKSRVFFVELKSPDKKLTDDQEIFQEWAKYHSYAFYVVQDINQWKLVKMIEYKIAGLPGKE